MWLDARAKLAEIESRPPATFATTATQPHPCRNCRDCRKSPWLKINLLSQKSQVSQARPSDIRNRAAEIFASYFTLDPQTPEAWK
jgi:hypothetical protein